MAEVTELRILTVCIGNVCRSPLMEALLRRRLPASVEVESAGVRAMAGYAMEPNAAAELARLGGSPDGFTARQLQAEYAGGADLVLTATTEIRSKVLAEAPRALRKAFTLLEFGRLGQEAPDHLESPHDLVAWGAANRSLAAGHDLDIPDPMGRAPEVHRQAADLIDEGTRQVAAALLRLSGVTLP
jgi:protein-tyrosine phosphatase